VKEGVAMNYLMGLCVMVFFCAMASAKEPMLEWTLKYMERQIPRDSSESLREASDYRKHKKDFKEKMSVANYTRGFTAAAAKASVGSMSLRLVLLPTADGKIRILGDYGPSGNKELIGSTIDPKRENRYGEQIILGGGGGRTRDKSGQVISARAGAFILVIKKMDGDFSKLIRSKYDKRQEERRGVGREKEP
jgi:hypothetical protein